MIQAYRADVSRWVMALRVLCNTGIIHEGASAIIISYSVRGISGRLCPKIRLHNMIDFLWKSIVSGAFCSHRLIRCLAPSTSNGRSLPEIR